MERKILVVDDNVTNVRLLQSILESENRFSVQTAGSGEAALRTITEHPPDLVLLDVMMPEMNGYALCSHLKTDPQLQEIPIIFISALDDVEDKVKAFTVGGVDYVTKPFRPDEVLARVRTQLALRDLQSQLQQANRELSRRLREVEVRNRDLDSFAHTVAHDLRSPINVILGYAELLSDTYETLPKEIIEESLTAIADAGYRMINITEELMLLAGVRTQEVEPLPISMKEIVKAARSRLMQLFRSREVEFQVPDTWPLVYGYGPWVEEVWVNYLSNAVKYGGQSPYVEVGSTLQGNGYACFWVRDNGPGLTAEECAQLFIPFERLGQVRTEGHGLGLSIVRRIVTKLGGEVGVESEKGVGSSFWFTLPRVEEEIREAALD